MITHRMTLDSIPFKKILNKEKDIELRLNDEKRKKIKIGDSIFFENKNNGNVVIRKVEELIVKSKFSEIFDGNFSKERGGFLKNEDVDSLMKLYYSEKKVEENGVIGIVLSQ